MVESSYIDGLLGSTDANVVDALNKAKAVLCGSADMDTGYLKICTETEGNNFINEYQQGGTKCIVAASIILETSLPTTSACSNFSFDIAFSITSIFSFLLDPR